MLSASLIFFALAIVGHGAFWVGMANRLHASAIPRRAIKLTVKVFYAIILGIPLALAYLWWTGDLGGPAAETSRQSDAASRSRCARGGT